MEGVGYDGAQFEHCGVVEGVLNGSVSVTELGGGSNHLGFTGYRSLWEEEETSIYHFTHKHS